MDPLIGLTIDTLGAFAMGALALAVWRVRPYARLNRTLAAMVATLAAFVLSLNVGWMFAYRVGPDALGRDVASFLAGSFAIVATALVLRFAMIFPTPLRRSGMRARKWLVPSVVALVYLLGVIPMVWAAYDAVPPEFGTRSGLAAASTFGGLALFSAAVWFLMARLALDCRSADEGDRSTRWQSAAVAIALGMFPLYTAGAGAQGAAQGPVHPVTVATLLVVVVFLMALWLWAGRGRAVPRAVAWSIGIIFIAGAAAARWFGFEVAINSGALGVLRLIGTGLLAYAIVRHQLFDIDLKIKWGISRGTLAGIFIAVFFVASEGAEELFSTALGPLWGILGAGLLVFAISPLQRLTERVADAAMPRVKDDPEYRLVRKREVYKAALESALMDGMVTERERSVLATLADELGLSAREALDLERAAATRR